MADERYGYDVSTFPDLDPNLRLITGLRVVAESVARLWLTKPGTLITDPATGAFLQRLLSSGVSAEELEELRQQLESIALEDERVSECRVEFTQDLDAGKIRIRGIITTSFEESFAMVLLATKVTTELLLEEAA